MYAVITAGGRVEPDFAAAIGIDVKALAPLGERRLIDAAIDAARAIGVAGIAVVGGERVRAHCSDRVDRFIDAADDGVENIRRALAAFPFERLVYLTSDLPFVNGDDLAAFVGASADAQLTMPLADAKAYERAYPFAPSHTMSLGGERFANGSVFVIDRAALAPLESLAGQFFIARKSLPKMAMLLGPALVMRFITRQLRIRDIEGRARALFGLDARAIRGSAPSLCYDIDTLVEWQYAERLCRSTYD